MRKTHRTIVAAMMMAAVAFWGCQQSEEQIRTVEEGLPVSISFGIEVPEMEDITVTRASSDVETRVEKMAILFYNAKQANSKPVIVRIDDLGQPTQRTETNWLYTINLSEEQLDGVYSGEWYMYPVANYDKYATFDLSDLATKTLAELKEYTVTASGRDITSTAVMMSGRYGTDDNTTITLQPGTNTFDNIFHLKRIVSKNIFTFVNGAGVTFTPQKYSIHSYSTSSTLIERAELNEYAGAGTFTDFTDLPVSGNSFTFYMPENTQIPAAKESWSYADRERRTKANYDTFEYAPVNSTYIVVEGLYEGPGTDSEGAEGSVTGNVKYTIHLGNFDTRDGKGGSYGNFTVKRNAEYNYKVTVNGVNNIIVEAETNVENNPGAEGQIVRPAPHVVVSLDAHYENVILSFNATGIANYNVSATTPDKSGRMETFLDVNGDEKASHTDEVSWVKFGKPASATTFNNYPANASDVVDIYTLIDEIKGETYTHCLKDGDNVYVQAYVDEYFYEDGRPYGSFVNTDDRSLSFVIGNAKISSDGHSSYIKGEGFTLKQKSIKTFYNDNAGNPFGLETVEETPAATISSDTYPGAELQNGLKNTREIISSATSSNWADYVNIATNGFIGKTAPAETAIMTTTGTNPLYECLSRNRDLNGDGTIDQDEIKWYVPAFRQYIFTWCGKKSLPSEITFEQENYLSSSNAGYRVWWALEGTAISSWASAGNASKVRCVRNLGSSSDEAVSNISDWDADNNVVTINKLRDEAIRTNTQTGEYPEHENFDAASTLPKAFKIAEANLNIPGSGDNYVPEVTVGSLPDEVNSSNAQQYHTIKVPVTVSNYDETKKYAYQIGTGEEIEFNSSTIDITVELTVNGYTTPQSTTLKIKSSNGNYSSFDVTVTPSRSRNNRVWIYNYKYTNTTPTTTIVTGVADKNKFKFEELMTGDWCEKHYSEEAGASDLGKWRIPNEKELYFIQLYCGEGFKLAGGNETQTDDMVFVGAKTKYKVIRTGATIPYMIYYLRKDGSSNTPIITTGDGKSEADFTVRCVRDYTPSSKSYDSSYNSGGTGFGL